MVRGGGEDKQVRRDQEAEEDAAARHADRERLRGGFLQEAHHRLIG